MPLRSSLLAIALLLAAPPAGAVWTESGVVDITGGLGPIEADEITPADVILSVRVGSGAASGVVSVVGEGDINTRRSLGDWDVFNGQGNIHSTFGTGISFRAATGNYPNSTNSVLDVLNSDIEGTFSAGEGGTLRFTASVVRTFLVAEGGNAYLTMGASAQILTTQSGAYVQIDESRIIGRELAFCRLSETTIVVRDSLFACANVDLANASDMDVFPNLTTFSEVRIEQELRIAGATLDVSSSIAETGGIELSPSTTGATALRVEATDWVNQGTFEFTSFADGPAEWVISGGSKFLQQGTAKVRSQAGANGLVVTGAGTELDVEADLLVGQTVLGVPQPTVPGTLSVGSGGVVIVRGTLVIGPLAVLNLNEGGTIYAAATEIHGTVNDNGGVLIVPEAGSALAGASCGIVLALMRRRRMRS